MSVRKWIGISGLVWLGIGSGLMAKGLRGLVSAMLVGEAVPLLKALARVCGTVQNAGLWVVCGALFVGILKARWVLAKTVERVVHRLESLELPITLWRAYDRRYLLLLGGMMGLGMVLRFVPLAQDVRSGAQITVGSALIQGALIYFRYMWRPARSP